MIDTIDIEIWKPKPGQPGTSILDYRRTIKDVIRELNTRLKADGMAPDEYGFDALNYDGLYPRASDPWPEYRWIACFAVTGGSEGHYIHIDVIQDADQVPDSLFRFVCDEVAQKMGDPCYGGCRPTCIRCRANAAMKRDSHSRRLPIALAKTFMGWDRACAIAAAAGKHLGA